MLQIVSEGRWLNVNWPLTENSVIYDIGGFKGEWTERISSIFPGTYRIFEPTPEFHSIIRDKFKNKANIFCFNLGIGERDKDIELGVSGDATSAYHYRQFEHYARVKQVDIKSVIDAQQVDLMAINAEGAEYEILPRLIETGQINQVKYLQIQFHDFVPQAKEKYQKIYEELSKTHERVFHWEWVWDIWQKK